MLISAKRFARADGGITRPPIALPKPLGGFGNDNYELNHIDVTVSGGANGGSDQVIVTGWQC